MDREDVGWCAPLVWLLPLRTYASCRPASGALPTTSRRPSRAAKGESPRRTPRVSLSFRPPRAPPAVRRARPTRPCRRGRLRSASPSVSYRPSSPPSCACQQFAYQRPSGGNLRGELTIRPTKKAGPPARLSRPPRLPGSPREGVWRRVVCPYTPFDRRICLVTEPALNKPTRSFCCESAEPRGSALAAST